MLLCRYALQHAKCPSCASYDLIILIFSLQMHDLELQLRRSQLDRGNSVAESVVGRDLRTQELAQLRQEVSA